MIFPFPLWQAPLGLLAFLTLAPAILARVAIEPLSSQQLTTSFRTYLGSQPGGCGRGSMMSHVLDSLGGANAIAQTVVQDLPTYLSQTYVRGLLFLFFGITFLSDHQINTDPAQNNQNAYNDILRRARTGFLRVQVLRTNDISKNFTAVSQVFVSPNPRYAKPRYRCLEDYASYYQHDVGTDGRENMSAPLIAQVLNVRSEPDFPDLSAWNFHD